MSNIFFLIMGETVVFTSCQNSWTNFRFCEQTFAAHLSLTRDFCTDLFGVGINQKMEVRRTVSCRKHHKCGFSLSQLKFQVSESPISYQVALERMIRLLV